MVTVASLWVFFLVSVEGHCSQPLGVLLVLKVTVASLHGVYFGVFDGHGGAGAALMVADQLINHLQVRDQDTCVCVRGEISISAYLNLMVRSQSSCR